MLLAVPYGKTHFEAWRPLTNDPLPSGYTYEELHEWIIHSKACAETEWKDAEQWNKPTSMVLDPGATVSCGIKFMLVEVLRCTGRSVDHPEAAQIKVSNAELIYYI